MNPPIRELLCQECDREYHIWHTSNALWNEVCGIDGKNINPDIAFLCPTCFIALAESKGIHPIWRVGYETDELCHCKRKGVLAKHTEGWAYHSKYGCSREKPDKDSSLCIAIHCGNLRGNNMDGVCDYHYNS